MQSTRRFRPYLKRKSTYFTLIRFIEITLQNEHARNEWTMKYQSIWNSFIFVSKYANIHYGNLFSSFRWKEFVVISNHFFCVAPIKTSATFISKIADWVNFCCWIRLKMRRRTRMRKLQTNMNDWKSMARGH